MESKKQVHITTFIQVKLFYQDSPPSFISARGGFANTAQAQLLGHVVAVDPYSPADVIRQLDTRATGRVWVKSSVQRSLNFVSSQPLKSILKQTCSTPKPQNYGRVNPDKDKDGDRRKERKRQLSHSNAEEAGTRKKAKKTHRS